MNRRCSKCKRRHDVANRAFKEFHDPCYKCRMANEEFMMMIAVRDAKRKAIEAWKNSHLYSKKENLHERI